MIIRGLELFRVQLAAETQPKPIIHFIDKTLPETFTMTTPNGQIYEFVVLQANKSQCQLRYRLRPGGDSELQVFLQRLAMLREKVKTVELQSQAGKVSEDQLWEAKIELLTAEAEMAKTQPKKRDCLEQIGELQRLREQSAQLLLAAGRLQQSDLDDIKLARLETEAQIAALEADQPIQNSSTPSLDQRMQSLVLKQTPLKEALRMLSQIYKVNIVPSKAIAEDHSAIPLTHLYDVNFVEALKVVCGTANTYIKQDNLIYVYTVDEFAKMKKTNFEKASNVLKDIEDAYAVALGGFEKSDVESAKKVMEAILPRLQELEELGPVSGMEVSVFVTQFRQVIKLIEQGENEKARSLFDTVGSIGTNLESQIQQEIEQDTIVEAVKMAAIPTAAAYSKTDFQPSGDNQQASRLTKEEGLPRIPLEFKITRSSFEAGDWIEITELLGTGRDLEVGRTYTVKGRYTLVSQDSAMLHVYATNGDVQSQQGPVISRGSGEFTRTFTYLKPGDLHLSFYPAKGGSSFASVYFDLDWQTAADSYIVNPAVATQGATVATNYGGTVVFGNAYQKGDGSFVEISDAIDRDRYEVRVVAVDKQGRIIQQNGGGGAGLDGVTLKTVRFDIPLKDIQLFRLQVRPKSKAVSLKLEKERSVEVDLIFEGTIEKIQVSSLPSNQNVVSLANFIVTFKVEKVLKGSFHEKGFSFRVHSPTQSNLEEGRRYRVEAIKTETGYRVDEFQWSRSSQLSDLSEIQSVVRASKTDDSQYQQWLEKISSLNDHKQAAFQVVPQLLKEQPPEVALQVVREAWPKISSYKAKQGVLKAFHFAKHPHTLAVLDLGVRDPHGAVVSYALTYVADYAGITFPGFGDEYTQWYEANKDKPLEQIKEEKKSIRQARLDEAMEKMLAAFKSGDGRDAYWQLAQTLGDAQYAFAIPAMIAMIDADNSYDTIYWVGYFGLSKITGVRYSPFHDGDWWRRWWAEHKADYPEAVRAIAIPELPKTARGLSHTPYPADIDTPDGMVRWMTAHFSTLKDGYPGWDDVAEDLMEWQDYRAIPYLIAAMDADSSLKNDISYRGLDGLTGVPSDRGYDAAWWKNWWQKNKTRYPDPVQSLDIEKIKQQYLLHPDDNDYGQRWNTAFNEALKEIRKADNWPQGPVELCQAFWQARVNKDYEALKIVWPGSASWDTSGNGWEQICQKDTRCDYVFGQPQMDGSPVSYASRDYFEKNGSYNLTMRLGSIETANGKRYYVISGN